MCKRYTLYSIIKVHGVLYVLYFPYDNNPRRQHSHPVGSYLLAPFCVTSVTVVNMHVSHD